MTVVDCSHNIGIAAVIIQRMFRKGRRKRKTKESFSPYTRAFPSPRKQEKR